MSKHCIRRFEKKWGRKKKVCVHGPREKVHFVLLFIIVTCFLKNLRKSITSAEFIIYIISPHNYGFHYHFWCLKHNFFLFFVAFVLNGLKRYRTFHKKMSGTAYFIANNKPSLEVSFQTPLKMR